MWRSLVWKEWREQRWKLAFGSALLVSLTLIGLRTRIVPDASIVALAVFVGGVLLPLMVSMGLVAPERADGTIVRLLALPVPAWHVLAVKGAVGAAACAGPVIASAAVAAIVAGSREMSWGGLLGFYGMATGVSIAMFTWMTAMSIRQPSEARAGLVGVGVVAGWFGLLAIGALLRLDKWIVVLSPMGMVTLHGGPPAPPLPRGAIVALQILIAALLWLWAARRLAMPGKVVA